MYSEVKMKESVFFLGTAKEVSIDGSRLEGHSHISLAQFQGIWLFLENHNYWG